MTPEAQRVAIAEACGAITSPVERHPTDPDLYARDERWVELPDYLSDLNAMHEAEKTLEGHQVVNYGAKLTQILWIACEKDNAMNDISVKYRTFHATATQRAEAFLRTVGKWKDESK